MKLKICTREDRSSSHEDWRGLTASHAQPEPRADASVEDELRGIEVESLLPPVSAPGLHGSDIPSDIPTATADEGRTTTRWTLRSPRLIGERAHRFHFLDTQEVDYLQVDGNYVTIHVGDGRYVTRSTLKHLSDVLSPYDFLRIDRSVLLNLRQVDYVERLEGGQFAFHLYRGRQLVSSRERSGAIVRLLRSGVR